jgi:hypothetical protein
MREKRKIDGKERIIILAFDVIMNFLIHRLIEWRRMMLLLKILVMLMLMMSVVAIAASA